jgi:hypothetical protein
MENNQATISNQLDHPPIPSPNSSSHLRRNILLIIACVLILGLVGTGGYELGVRKNIQSIPNIPSTSNSIPTLIPSPSVILPTLYSSSVTPINSGVSNITLPVTVLKTGYGISGPNGQTPTFNYPKSITLSIPNTFTNMLSAYGASEKVIVGPKDWTGDGSVGADGNEFISLYPVGGSTKSGPHITFEELPACQSCILGDAALYFPAAKILYEKNFPAPIKIPEGLIVKPLTSSLVNYTLPYTTDGLAVTGTAFYGGSPNVYFTKMEVVISPSQSNLTEYILNDYTSRQIGTYIK